jgi:serine/threonine-protein phosphatase 2A regulatory subunit B
MECDSNAEQMEVDEVDEGKMWKFSQLKGVIDPSSAEEMPAEADLISCVQFSHDGELLATGDRGGRIVIFQQNQGWNSSNGARSCDYNVYSTFQSHEPEFDYLKSLEIEEKINQIKWLKRKSPAQFILSTNDKTIKLWKISEREKKVADGNYNLGYVNGTAKRVTEELVLPRLESMELVVEVSPRRVYSSKLNFKSNFFIF